MTEGETRFYLREIHLHWSNCNLSSEKLAELTAAKLIEVNGPAGASVRLTSEGARCKALGRPRGATGVAGGLSLTGKPEKAPRRSPRKIVRRAQRLV